MSSIFYKSKYDLIKDADEDTDDSGNAYGDIFTLYLDEFIYTKRPYMYELTSNDVIYFDQVILNYYGVANYYDDMVLMLNDIPYLNNDYVGVTINLPSKIDLDNFYNKQITGV